MTVQIEFNDDLGHFLQMAETFMQENRAVLPHVRSVVEGLFKAPMTVDAIYCALWSLGVENALAIRQVCHILHCDDVVTIPDSDISPKPWLAATAS